MTSSVAKHLVCQLALATAVLAGTPAPKAPPSEAIIPPKIDPWEVTLSPYGWLAGLEGTTGVRGFTAETEVAFKDILSNLDMTAMLNLEARKGRWGGWVDGLYLKMSMDGQTPGPLLDSVGLSVEQIVAEAALFYRVWQDDRGFLDLYAGARYMSVGGELSLRVSDSGVEQLSRRLSDAVVNRVVDEVSSIASSKAASAKGSLTSKITDLVSDRLAEATSRASAARNQASERKSEIAAQVAAKGAEARALVGDLQDIAASHPRLVEVIRNSERIQAALRNAVRTGLEQRALEAQLEQKVTAAQQDITTLQNATATVQSQIERALAALSTARAELDAARSSARSRAKSAVEKANKKLASAIESALREAIPDQISQTADWVDPFVGMRARYNFSNRLYAVAKADIGGFGVSSDLVWQAYGALGYHLSKSGKTTVELGYKYMAVDYAKGGFTYDVAMSGVMLNIGFRF
jgi:uncharacterized protein YycO